MSTPYFCFDFNDGFDFQYFYICTFILFAFVMQDTNFIFYSLYAKRHPAYVTRFLFYHCILDTIYFNTVFIHISYLFLFYIYYVSQISSSSEFQLDHHLQ